MKYEKLKFSGKLLKEGFSIYLIEIKTKAKSYFYIGMTGDNFYPSARSAFHRISGHLEKISSSTQNQINNALSDKSIDLDNVDIIMYHFPLVGFKKWTLSETKKAAVIKQNKSHEDYILYKKNQLEILAFENHLIYSYKEKINDRLLNKTNGKQIKKLSKRFEQIQAEFETIII